VIAAALKHDVDLETSSSFDIDLILNLYEKGEIDKSVTIVHNGYKTDDYISKIIDLQNRGFKNSITVLDSPTELSSLERLAGKNKIKIGVRMAIDEEPQSAYYTSRLGIRHTEMLDFFNNRIKGNDKFELKMFHFFVDSGIKDTLYYWGEFQKALNLYIKLKKQCETLDSFNLGGGFPIRNHLGFEYSYDYMINEIIKNIKDATSAENVPDPDIFTEFGKYTVGERGAIIFKVLEQSDEYHSRCLVDSRKIHSPAH